ncbi:MAG: sulfatase-like hydrolase/transferase, partial [Chlamydiales bacterium]|nr:sulfatase-like hydrolase/transferase [Chlamydiales bacterium]
VIFSGVWIFRATEKWTDRRAVVLSFPMLSAFTGLLLLALIAWDTSMGKKPSVMQIQAYQKTLPWKTTLLPAVRDHLVLDHYLRSPQEEEETLRSLDSRAFSLARKPDVYLFIIESLREDFINKTHSPHIDRFKEGNLSFDLALSNSNATQTSWFSIFFSEYPFYWGKIHPDNWNEGSVPLRVFKKLGYAIHAFSSARLGYYQMDHLIFGKTQYLADTLFTPDEEAFDEPYQRDQITMERLWERMDGPEEGGGRVFIVFLDATHLDYSWPKEEGTLFHPFEEKINYFKVACSNRGVEKIQNRYRNSLHFVDSLMGQFFEKLESCAGGSQAVVVLTADHGEEFYEHGHLFHASGLTKQQTHIPLYYRFGSDGQVRAESICKMSCHMDIFPTLFHYILGEDLFEQELRGQSIFKVDRSPYIMSCRFNASRPPYEFFIHNGKEKVTARFDEKRDVFHSKKINILSKKNLDEENIAYDLSSLKEELTEAIERLCQP